MINVALVGIGNCASTLVQGIHYYKRRKELHPIGLMHKTFGQYTINDIKFVAAFDEVYQNVSQKLSLDEIAAIIDPLRTMALITMVGITPALKNHGYRSRLLSKRFVMRTANTPINDKEIVQKSYLWWKEQGVIPEFSLETVQDIISKENSRNSNDLLRKKLQEKLNIKTKLDINEEPEVFITKIQRSVPKNQRQTLIEFIQQGGQYE
ncbi:MAG: hypothetical protein J6Y85_01825 [Alphaproteobacteria bacterium]|nr:hypothetical protein [Alphaproteobacteria bacterium]